MNWKNVIQRAEISNYLKGSMPFQIKSSTRSKNDYANVTHSHIFSSLLIHVPWENEQESNNLEQQLPHNKCLKWCPNLPENTRCSHCTDWSPHIKAFSDGPNPNILVGL